MNATTCEFWEAQYCVEGNWFRLGGRTLEGAREAIENAKNSRGVTARILGEDNSQQKYRVRHFVGTVETVE